MRPTCHRNAEQRIEQAEYSPQRRARTEVAVADRRDDGDGEEKRIEKVPLTMQFFWRIQSVNILLLQEGVYDLCQVVGLLRWQIQRLQVFCMLQEIRRRLRNTTAF